MSTTEPAPTLQPSELGTLFSDLFTAWRRCLCPEATHGALVVGGPHANWWKSVLINPITSCYGSASKTVSTTVSSRSQSDGVSLHYTKSSRRREMSMLARSKGTLFQTLPVHCLPWDRRLVQCYFETCDLEACKVHVSRLLESKIANPLNHYLAYCLALKIKDADGGLFSTRSSFEPLTDSAQHEKPSLSSVRPHC
jgi:hypothetical protein